MLLRFFVFGWFVLRLFDLLDRLGLLHKVERLVEGGLILTDDIRAEIYAYLVSAQLDTAYGENLPLWQAQLTITVDEAMIELVQQEANAAMAAQ